jgi:CBS-domain-containing membrane protein
MRRWCVSDVMTRDVVTVNPDTLYKETADLLVSRRVSAVPVVDGERRVVGLVSESDLLAKLEYNDRTPKHALASRRLRDNWRKATGDTVAELMTTPVRTISPDASVSEAARAMDIDHVRRLPVVDADGKLIGIVSRRDLVRLYTRPDDEVRLSITQDVLPALWVEPGTVKVAVRAGVVTLTGSVHRRSMASIVARVVEATPGVVDVVNELGFGFDDGELVEQHWFDSHPFSGRLPYPAMVHRTDR